MKKYLYQLLSWSSNFHTLRKWKIPPQSLLWLVLLIGTLFIQSSKIQAQCKPIIHTGDFITASFVTACTSSQNLQVQTGASSYNWQFSTDGGITFSSVGNNSNFYTATQVGSYKVAANFSTCSVTFSSVVHVQFTSVPTIIEGTFLTACASNTLQLTTQTGAISYNWQFSNNNGITFSSIGANAAFITTNKSGLYKVGINQPCGTIFSTITNVQFNSAGIPNILNDTFITACAGNPPNLTATSSPLGYRWEFKPQGGTIFSQIAGNQQFISANNSGEYRVKFISSCTPQFSSVVHVQFTSVPTIIEGTFLTACASNTLQLSTQTGAINYNWQFSNNNGITFSSIGGNAAFITTNKSGLYKVGINQPCGTIFSTITNVQFTTSIVIPTIIQGTFVSACAGGNNVLFTSTNATNYQWNFSPNNTTFISIGGNNNQITFTSTGFYRVGTLVGCGWGFSSVTQVHFTSSVAPIIQQGQFLTACATNPPTLNTQIGQGGYIWQFRPNMGTPFNTIGGNSSSLVASQTGDYRVKFMSSCQPNLFSSITQVQFSSVATIQEGTFVSACLNGAKPILHVTNGAASYQWQFAQRQGDAFQTVSGSSHFLTANIAGLYRAGIDFGCGIQFTSATQVEFTTSMQPRITEAPFITGCPNGSVTLHAQGAGSLQWQKVVANGLNFNYIDIPGATNNSLNVFTSGSYRVKFVSATGGCAGVPSNPVEVSFVSAKIPLIQTDALDPYARVYNTQQGSGTYTNNGGQKWQVAVCNGGSIQLQTEAGAQNYQWYISSNWNNWSPITGANASNLTVTQGSRYYKVRITRADGCPQDSRPMYVMPAIGSINTPVLEQNSPITLQSGEIKLSTRASNWRYKWQFTPNLSQPFITIPNNYPDYKYNYTTRKYSYTVRKAGFYRVYNTNGCEVRFSTVIEVQENNFNDPPNFQISEPYNWFSVRNDIGKHSRLNFVTAIDDGDSDLNQEVNFFVSANDPSYFTVQPFMTTGGKLCFTPNPNKGGYTTLAIYAQDNGAGNAPNINKSTVRTCGVWIMPKNYAFLDVNKNGTYEKGSEYPMIQKRIKARKKSSWNNVIYNHTTYTCEDGSYYAYVYPARNNAPGYYKFTPYASDYPAGATFVPTKYEDNNVTQRGYLSGKHFAIQTATNTEDVSTRIMTWWNWGTRPGFKTFYAIKCENNGTKVKNAILSFKFDPLLTFERTWTYRDNGNTQLLAVTNRTASWTCNNLKPGESRYIWVQVRVQRPTASRNLLGERVYCSAEIKPIGTDIRPQNNKYNSVRTIRGSYDPNDKRVLPEGDVPPQFVVDGEFLTYRVRFQNSGTDTAFNIRVEDQLSNKLDWESLEMLGASHNYRFEIDSTGKGVWYFENILLPDDKVDEAGSHGQFEYRIKIKNDGSVKFGDKFGTKAYIYFDYNTPIITNQSDTRVWADLVAPKTESFSPTHNGTLSASSSDLFIEFDEPIKANQGRIYLRKADGTLLQSFDIQSNEVSLSQKALRIETTGLTEDETYYVQMDYGTVWDLAKNQFAGISDDKTWRFTVDTKDANSSTTLPTSNPANSNFKFPIPDQVKGLKQDEVKAGRISLSWIATTTFVEAYKVLRRTGSGDFDTLAITKYPLFVDESVEPNTTYEYKILAFNNGGYSESKVLMVQTLPLTPVLETIQAIICEGREATLTVKGTNTTDSLRWYTDKETTTSFGLGATISVSEAGTYYVARFLNGQASERASVKVSMSPVPEAKIQAGERTFCGEGTIEAESVNGASYTWKNADGQVVGNNRILTINKSDNYAVTVEKGGCSTTSQSIFVKINPSSLTPEILEGKTVVFCNAGQLNAKVITGAKYIWAKDGNVLSDTSSKLTVTESGKYTLQIAKAECKSNPVSTQVGIIIPEKPEVIVDLKAIYPNQEATLRTNYLKNARLQWYKDGQLLETKYESRLTISEAGDYFVKAIYKAGCETISQTITITAKEVPSLVFTNGKIVLTGDADIRSVQWYQNGKAIYNFDGEPTEAGVYTVTIILKDGTKLQLEEIIVNDKVLGIEEENKYGFEIYPNPTTGNFSFSAKNDYLGKVQILITDMTGKTIYQKAIKKTSETMVFRPNINQWSKGAYLMKVKFGDKQVVRTIIKE